MYLSVVELDASHAAALNNLAWTMHRTGDGRARDYGERALKLDPDDPAILDTVGTILSERGEPARAIELLQRAIARAPTAIPPRINLAKAWLKAGNPHKARQELELALKADPAPDQVAEIRGLQQQLAR
jgi:Tfp pilus assembly protein PilF